jgi:hypothetical protein
MSWGEAAGVMMSMSRNCEPSKYRDAHVGTLLSASSEMQKYIYLRDKPSFLPFILQKCSYFRQMGSRWSLRRQIDALLYLGCSKRRYSGRIDALLQDNIGLRSCEEISTRFY